MLAMHLVADGKIPQVLAGRKGAQQKLDGAGPVAEILRQHRRAGDVAAARGIVDGAVGAHQRGERVFDFPGAGKAAADPDFLSLGRGRDLQPRRAGRLDHRIGVRIVEPPRPAIERHVESGAVGPAAAADRAARLYHHDLAPCGGDLAGGRDAGRAGPDHDNVSFARDRGPREPRAHHCSAQHQSHRTAARYRHLGRPEIVISWFPKACRAWDPDEGGTQSTSRAQLESRANLPY